MAGHVIRAFEWLKFMDFKAAGQVVLKVWPNREFDLADLAATLIQDRQMEF